jgi:hypothetical protein
VGRQSCSYCMALTTPILQLSAHPKATGGACQARQQAAVSCASKEGPKSWDQCPRQVLGCFSGAGRSPAAGASSGCFSTSWCWGAGPILLLSPFCSCGLVVQAERRYKQQPLWAELLLQLGKQRVKACFYALTHFGLTPNKTRICPNKNLGST